LTEGDNETMRKYIMFIIIIFGCSFILLACNSDTDAEDQVSDQESVEEKKSDDEEDANESSDSLSSEKEDIEFGDKVDMGEKTSIENALAFLDDIKYPDIQLKDDENSRFFVKKSEINSDEPEYFLNLNYNGYDSNDTSTFLQFYVFTSEEDYEEKASQATETKILSDGTEVRWEIHENGSRRAFLEDGDFYYMLTTPRETEKMSDETLMKAIEGLSEKNYVYDLVKEGLHQSAEDYFALPTYFPNNIEFHTATINDVALSLDYFERYYIDGDEGVFTSINLSMSDVLEAMPEEYDEEIELPSGRKALISIGSDDNYNNKIYFEEDGLNFDLSTRNLERPLDNENLDELKKIADSLQKVPFK